LPYLDASRQQNDYLILPSVIRGVHLLEKDVEIILIPQFEYCYGFVGFQDFVKKAVRQLEKSLDPETKTKFLERAETSPKWNAFLSYPIAEKDSALNLTVLAHELAHLADQATGFYKRLLPLKLDEASFQQLRPGHGDTELQLTDYAKCTGM